MMEFQIELSSTPFNLDYTLDCGQAFRWRREYSWWIGVVEGSVLKLKYEAGILKVKSNSDKIDEKFIEQYFRLEDPLFEILASINKDNFIECVISRFRGLRLLRQNPWECMISFICATNKNIKAIQKMISNLSLLLGKEKRSEGKEYYSFPDPFAVASADKHILYKCGLGYRAKFVMEVARRIVSKDIILEDLKKISYEDAKQILLCDLNGDKMFPGVGPKVADCIMLFSLEKIEAFPIDVWIKRVIASFYSYLFDDRARKLIDYKLERNSIVPREYNDLSKTMRSHFGSYAGYAQEYLYHYAKVKDPLPSFYGF